MYKLLFVLLLCLCFFYLLNSALPLWSLLMLILISHLNGVLEQLVSYSLILRVCWGVVLVQITTDYNDANNCCECLALQRFNAGDQVCTVVRLLLRNVVCVMTLCLPCSYTSHICCRDTFAVGVIQGSQVPAVCQCTAKLHVLNDEYTRLWRSVARYHWFCSTVSTVKKYRGTR